nr:putative tape measure protein [uncultured Mediterranean phage uvMED]
MASQKLHVDIIARDKSKQALTQLQKNLGNLKRSIFNIRNAFLGLGAGVVIKGFINAGIQIENLEVQLNALFGSAREGKKALKAVTDFAAGTPFELKNIQQGITALATVREKAEASGVSFEELLKITGNTATVLGGDFALAALQIQRSFSAGISSAELFRERGVKAMAGFKEGVRVSTDQSIAGLSKAFGTGGKFGNLIDDLSKTLFGTISNIKDAFFIFQVEVSKGFFEALKSNLGDLKKTVETNKQSIAEFGNTIGKGLSSAINGTVSAVKFLKENLTILIATFKFFIALKLIIFFKNLATSIALAKTAMLGFNKVVGKNLLIGGLALVISQLDVFIAKIKELAGMGSNELEDMLKPGLKMIEVVDRFGNTIKIVVKDLDHASNQIMVGMLPPIKEAETRFQKIVRHIKETIEKINDLNKGALDKAKEKFKNIKDTVAKTVNEGITKMSNALAKSVIMGENLADSFRKMAQEFAVRVLSAIIEIVARMAVQLAIEKLITREKKQQREHAEATAMLSGNPLGFLSFFGAFHKGGTVSKGKPIVVGERGPEMFIPNSTGQITQSARGTSGGPVNVNFNINTVDASGFDELLARSRGTITAIINSAVNERGREALI